MRWCALIPALILVSVSTSSAEECHYGLHAPTAAECADTQKEALKRVASAKTICYSANSQIQWRKGNKEPVGAFTTMRAGARAAMKGFTNLLSCERADLVVKTDYDVFSDATVTLTVIDAESGDNVFWEKRSISDLSSDVTRMAMHFQNMRSEAIAEEVAVAAAQEAMAKQKAFLAHLPKHWRYVRNCDSGSTCPEGTPVDVWVNEGVLRESSTQMLKDSIKLETNCTVKEGADEYGPWTGLCNYHFVWPDWRGLDCTVQTGETITTISAQKISGRSERVDFSPTQRTPRDCPMPADESRDFTLVPDKEQASNSGRTR